MNGRHEMQKTLNLLTASSAKPGKNRGMPSARAPREPWEVQLDRANFTALRDSRILRVVSIGTEE